MCPGEHELHGFHAAITGTTSILDMNRLYNGRPAGEVLPASISWTQPYANVYNTPPRVGTGLYMFDCGNQNSIRIGTQADATYPDGFKATAQAWDKSDNTVDFGISWLRTGWRELVWASCSLKRS